jgi:hypothetical protein
MDYGGKRFGDAAIQLWFGGLHRRARGAGATGGVIARVDE